MAGEFKVFIECEIAAMNRDMDESIRADAARRQQWTVEWVRDHAAEFREVWNRAQPQNRCAS